MCLSKADVVLAQVVAYLAKAPKSIAVYGAMKAVKECVLTEPNAPVPLHICNAPTALMRQLGFGDGYVYPPSVGYAQQVQSYLPESLTGRTFLEWPPITAATTTTTTTETTVATATTATTTLKQNE